MRFSWEHAIIQIAERVYQDPTSATVDDADKLARAHLVKILGKLPEKKPRQRKAIRKP